MPKQSERYLGESIPKLGFGLMRLPKNGDDIDIQQTKDMVDAFMDAGLTYFDTARAYGASEDATRQALVERYPRESYQLATKNAPWLNAASEEEARQLFTTSLEKTGAGYFDYYLLHNLGGTRTAVFDEYHLWDFVQELKAEGLVKHVGFSFHDTADILEDILVAHPEIEFVQLQINYADWENNAVQARACYEVARKHGKPVIIMEPLKGGTLANPPEPVADVLTAADPDASPISWALRFALSLEGVITVLSGMSSVEQMRDNIAILQNFTELTSAEEAVLREAQAVIEAVTAVPCTSCRYCMKECPSDINIAGIMDALNQNALYGEKAGSGCYNFATRMGSKATDCIACGQCEEVCPQHIKVIDELEVAAGMFDGGE